MSVTRPGNISKNVTITENYGEWHVIVHEDDCDDVRSFEIEAQARSYADGQRLRLALNLDGGQ